MKLLVFAGRQRHLSNAGCAHKKGTLKPHEKAGTQSCMKRPDFPACGNFVFSCAVCTKSEKKKMVRSCPSQSLFPETAERVLMKFRIDDSTPKIIG